MQNIFAENTPWHLPWLRRVLPAVVELSALNPERTFFTRFITPKAPESACGAWRRYYNQWNELTTQKVDPSLLDLVPELARFVPPAEIVDKTTYGPWLNTDLHARLRRRNVDTLVVTGGETDVCVLATVLGAVDLGYRVIVVVDALCSSSDEAHDAQLSVYHKR